MKSPMCFSPSANQSGEFLGPVCTTTPAMHFVMKKMINPQRSSNDKLNLSLSTLFKTCLHLEITIRALSETPGHTRACSDDKMSPDWPDIDGFVG